IGWAYDGNPIYGPYGYSSETGGEIKAMVSGYQLIPQTDRPEGFPNGFFVEDYTFTNFGDLDEHNGRFCKTPDHPEGVYAYFATINPESDGFDTTYLNYRRPVFPYLIGDTYKSKSNQFNFLPSSNQESFDLTEGDYIKNTYPYKLNGAQSEYEFITQPFKISQQLSILNATSKGSIENIAISSIGVNYKVGDTIVFDNTDTNGRGATAKINEVVEKRIISLESAINILENVSFNILDQIGTIEGITTIPHALSTLDIVNISKVSDERFSKLSGFYNINVLDNRFTLSSGVGTPGITGITTFLYFVNSVNNDNLTANDVLKITNPGVGTEKLLVLDVDSVFNRVKVKREYDNTVGYAYSAYTTVIEDPRRFTFNSGFSTTLTTNSRRKIFFDPNASIAIGTVGIGTTINISVGSSVKGKFVPLQSIYIPNHNLITGQRLIYSNEGNTSISVFDNISGNRQLSENISVYVAKLSNDLIGISTYPIGIGSTGGFVGIGTTATVLYFTSIGSGVYHSFKTQENELTANIQKVVCTLTTKQDHGLFKNAKIDLNVLPGITTSVVIKYNSANRRLVANPKSFGSSGINTLTDSIIITDHNYKTGNKVIYTSSNPATGLINDKIYYVVRIDRDSFRLVDSFYQTTLSNPNYINITGTGSGHELSEVNPPLELFNGNTVNFDLSDSSLSDLNGGTRVQSFDFDLYESSLFTNKFITSLSSDNFEVKKIGTIGVTNDAKLTLTVSNNVPQKL
ncbi:YHYH protein, partial [archaeon]|nr:YHYH protein [archaeon]